MVSTGRYLSCLTFHVDPSTVTQKICTDAHGATARLLESSHAADTISNASHHQIAFSPYLQDTTFFLMCVIFVEAQWRLMLLCVPVVETLNAPCTSAESPMMKRTAHLL